MASTLAQAARTADWCGLTKPGNRRAASDVDKNEDLNRTSELTAGLGRTGSDNGPLFLAVADGDLTQGKNIKPFDARHVETDGLNFATHHVVCIDAADLAEVVLCFTRVPTVCREQVRTCRDP